MHLLGKFSGQSGVVVAAAEASVVKSSIRRSRRSARGEHLAACRKKQIDLTAETNLRQIVLIVERCEILNHSKDQRLKTKNILF